MDATSQGAFALTQPGEKLPRKRVRDTSRQAYAHGRETFTGRKADTLRWLAAFWNRWQMSPTIHQLTSFVIQCGEAPKGISDRTALRLHIARGISDLQKVGIVEAVPGGAEKGPNGRVCETWRVREIGSEEGK